MNNEVPPANQPWERTPNMYRDLKAAILNPTSKLTANNFSRHEPYAKILREMLAQPVPAAN